MSSIKTPDQKLRVFISSTINELAEERKIARETILRLNLTPVLFEMGARPYPPRDLYQAYLDQSQVFVGIYWKSYGWIAPEMKISGLEDEYRLSRNKPSLIYIKETSEQRDPELDKLIGEMESTGSISYQKFSTSEQLGDFLLNDLSVLLSEQFEKNISGPAINNSMPSHYPVMRNPLIGREKELNILTELLLKHTGLLTIIGPGGTGKTSIALQLCKDLEKEFRDGVHFIELASVTDTELIPATIAAAIGLSDSGKQAIEETLIENLRDKKALIVLDNFEQILSGTKMIISILEKCPSVSILVTSRSPLHLRYEQIFPLMPLQNPDPGIQIPFSQAIEYPSVQLFVDRAKKINPDLPINEENVNAIRSIVEKLDGLPLAIEIAAARTRIFTPVQLRERMATTTAMLSMGAHDLPERQQTLYAAIDWSYHLIKSEDQVFFKRLSVFSHGWSLSAAEAICKTDGKDVLDIMDQLMDFGLIRLQTKIGATLSEPRFEMLETVREFATLKLQESTETEQMAIRHSEYFLQYVAGSVPKGWTHDASSLMEKVEIDFQNITKAFNYSIQVRDYKTTWTFIGVLMPLWFYRGHINESLSWIESAGMTIPLVMEKADSGDMNLNLCGTALLSTGVLYYYAGKYTLSHEFLIASRKLLERTEDKENLAWSLMYISLNGLSLEDLFSVSNFQNAIAAGKECEDKMPYMISQAFYTEVLLAQGMTEEALQLINEVEQLANAIGYDLVKAIVCFQKSNLLYFMGDYMQARDGYLQAINIFIKVNFLATMGWACGLYGSCLTLQRQYEEARQQLLTALTKGREAGDKEMILFSLSLIAANQAAMGANAKAVQIMRSVSQFINLNQHYNAWSTSKKSLQVISQIFEQANLMNEIKDQAGKVLSLEEAITLAFA